MQLIKETLSYSDVTMLGHIEAEPLAFLQSVVEIMQATGDSNLTWLELVLMVEWKKELDAALGEKSVSKNVITHLASFGKR